MYGNDYYEMVWVGEEPTSTGGIFSGILTPLIVLLVILALVVVILFCTLKIVRQQTVYIIETLGKYSHTWEAGLHFKIPFIQTIAAKVSLKEQVADFPPQAVITSDNVMLTINSVVYFRIIDPRANTYGVENYLAAIEKLSATSLRSIVGEMLLDETLSSRDTINSKMLQVLDSATDPWGIDITRVEIQDITPPAQMQDAMEKQATAERNKRAAILTAEGEKESAILTAQGNKESVILKAEAEKEKMLREAEGQAEAIERVAQANKSALIALKEAHVDEGVLVLKKLSAMTDVANGRATKIIIPSDLMGVAGMTEVIGSVAKDAEELESGLSGKELTNASQVANYYSEGRSPKDLVGDEVDLT